MTRVVLVGWRAKGGVAGCKRINKRIQRLTRPAPIKIHCFLERLSLFLFGHGTFRIGVSSDPSGRTCCAFLRASMIRLILKPPGVFSLGPLKVHSEKFPDPERFEHLPY